MTAQPTNHLLIDDLQRGLDGIRQSPTDMGVIRMLVRRPKSNTREVLTSARLDAELGFVGDYWHSSGDTPSQEMQLTLMNSRVIDLVAQEESRWPLAGDQIYLDLDLSIDNLPIGSRLAVGGATIEVAALPHLGCRQFAERYGTDAVKFVNSELGKQLRLRGVNARIVQTGDVRVGDVARKLQTL